MREKGQHPLSKVPHFEEVSEDSTVESRCSNSLELGQDAIAFSKEKNDNNSAAPNFSKQSTLPTLPSTDHDSLSSNCRYCQDYTVSSELEMMLHCDGIWLHALSYRGDGWAFTTRPPHWAQVFPDVDYTKVGIGP